MILKDFSFIKETLEKEYIVEEDKYQKENVSLGNENNPIEKLYRRSTRVPKPVKRFASNERYNDSELQKIKKNRKKKPIKKLKKNKENNKQIKPSNLNKKSQALTNKDDSHGTIIAPSRLNIGDIREAISQFTSSLYTKSTQSSIQSTELILHNKETLTQKALRSLEGDTNKKRKRLTQTDDQDLQDLIIKFKKCKLIEDKNEQRNKERIEQLEKKFSVLKETKTQKEFEMKLRIFTKTIFLSGKNSKAVWEKVMFFLKASLSEAEIYQLTKVAKGGYSAKLFEENNNKVDIKVSRTEFLMDSIGGLLLNIYPELNDNE